LMEESVEFRWNVDESGKFSMYSMCKDLIQRKVPVDNNEKVWKMNIPLKMKVFA
jgi:hypothetical protein